MGFGWENCDPTLRAWVMETCSGLQAELGALHVGTYLHGSLAAGSFYPPKSDVDVLFIVDGPVDTETRRRFSTSAVFANRRRPIVGSLECSVVRRSALDERVHPMPFEVHFGEEWSDDILSGRTDFEANRSDPDLAAHVQATCEFGVALDGPDVEEVFTAPSHADFVDSIRRDIAWILEGENILESPYYGVLNVARVLWVLEEASPRLVPSKEEAGEWLLRAAPDRHRELIQLALDVYRDPSLVSADELRTGGRAWPTEALIRFRDWVRERADASEPTGILEDACRRILERVARRRTDRPFLVGLDGPTGAGKSRLASILREKAEATVVASDDFFAAQIPDADWDARLPAERARDCIDWRRLRSAALEPLLAGKPAEWHPFDFVGGPRPDGSYAFQPDPVRVVPSSLVVLEGAYSCRPELSDLIDLRVLVDAPAEVRQQRLALREEPEFLRRWHARWDAAEAHYFERVSPREEFDLLVENP